jgi:hypothetical protein
MDRVVATYRLDGHEVALVEAVEDEGVVYSVIVDGRPGDERFGQPPDEDELRRVVTRRVSR